jgi:hypothetical protein
METKETVTTEVVNLSNRNEKLCQELTEIDQLAQRLERHKEQVLETADKELGEAKVTSGTELSPGGGRAGLREGGRESHAQLWGLLCGGSVYAFSDLRGFVWLVFYSPGNYSKLRDLPASASGFKGVHYHAWHFLKFYLYFMYVNLHSSGGYQILLYIIVSHSVVAGN